MVPITRRASSPTPKNVVFLIFLLIINHADTLKHAVGIILDTFAGEAGEGKVGKAEMIGGYFYC